MRNKPNTASNPRTWSFLFMSFAIGCLLAWLPAAQAAEPAPGVRPVITWTSTPVLPGETVVALGEGWGNAPVCIDVCRLPDGRPGDPGATPAADFRKPVTVEPLQVTSQSLKFALPAKDKPGIFAFRVAVGNTVSDPVLLNLPEPWWLQGEQGQHATPGGWLRIFGKNLNLRGASLVGLGDRQGRVHTLKSEDADSWHVRVRLTGVAPGSYRVWVHNGAGGNAGWQAAGELVVSAPPAWKTDRFYVTEFGAIPNDDKDDTAAVTAALARARENGGGIVCFPRGRYVIGETLAVPQRTVLQGEDTELTALHWPDRVNPFPALIAGTNSFAVRDLCLYAVNHVHGIASDPGSVPQAGHVYLERVRMRVSRFYRINRDADEVDKRLRFNPGADLFIGGTDVRVTDCDIYGSEMSMQLNQVRYGLVARNRLHNGPGGWYNVAQCENLIFEDNEVIGDEMSSGGGIAASHNVYFARNTIQDVYGYDREGICSDTGGGVFTGRIAAVNGTKLALANDAAWVPPTGPGFAICLTQGTGAGQYRRVVRGAGREVEIDRPWTIPPTADTLAVIASLCGHLLVVGNTCIDVGHAMTFYGVALENVVARNRSVRSGGFHHIGLNYFADGGWGTDLGGGRLGFEPSWFVQYFDNEIVEGNSYSGPHGELPATDSGFFAECVKRPPPPGPLVRASIFRRNLVRNNGRFMVLGPVQDVLFENGTVMSSDVGIEVDASAGGVLLRGNRLTGASQPLTGAGLSAAAIHPAEKLSTALGMLAHDIPDLGGSSAWQSLDKRLAALAAEPPNGTTMAQKVQTCLADALKLAGRGQHRVRPEALQCLFGLELQTSSNPALDDLLAAGPGGEAPVTLRATVDAGTLVKTVTASVTLVGAAQATPASATELRLSPNTTVETSCKLRLPPGTWGVQSVRTDWVVQGNGWEFCTDSTTRFGSGAVCQWLVTGPFANPAKTALCEIPYPPEMRLDVAAQYDTPTGKVGWQPTVANSATLDLVPVLGKPDNTVAYAVAVLRAKRAMPVQVRVASRDGSRTFLNDLPILTNPEPGVRQALARLEPGDNVLLCQVTRNAGPWQVSVDVWPDAAVPPGELTVVPAAELQQLPCLRPAAATPVPEGAGLPLSGGVDWRLLFRDDFAREKTGGMWRTVIGQWTVERGALCTSAEGLIAFNRTIKAPWRLEYDTTSPLPRDLSCVWMHADEDYPTGYFFGFGAGGNTRNTIQKQGNVLATAKTPLPEPNRRYHVVVQATSAGLLMAVDGQKVLECRDPDLLPTADSLGFRTWGKADFSGVLIYGSR